MQTITELLAQELNCRQEYIANVIALLDEGNTIPFIARYRKEQHRRHGRHDAPRRLTTRLQYLRNLAPAARGGQGLHRRAGQADGRAGRGHRRGRDARARSRTSTAPTSPSAARARRSPGKRASSRWPTLSLPQTLRMDPPETLAAAYIDPDKGVGTLEDALAGASRHPRRAHLRRCGRSRKSLRALMHRRGTAASAAPRRRTRRQPSTASITTFSQPISRTCRAIRSWPSTAASARAR